MLFQEESLLIGRAQWLGTTMFDYDSIYIYYYLIMTTSYYFLAFVFVSWRIQ